MVMTELKMDSEEKGMYFDFITFKIENKLHRVPRHGFEQWSVSLFADMLSIPQGDSTVEGATDESPIYPPDCTNHEFESLMKIMYPQVLLTRGNEQTLKKDEWTSALKLSRQWDMPEISLLIIDNINKLTMTSTEKVLLGRRFRNRRWLLEGYTDIVKGCNEKPLDNTIGDALGWKTAAVLMDIARRTRSFMPTTAMVNERLAIPLAQMTCTTAGPSIMVRSPVWPSRSHCGCGIAHHVLYLKHDAPCLKELFERASEQDTPDAVQQAFKDELEGCIVDSLG